MSENQTLVQEQAADEEALRALRAASPALQKRWTRNEPSKWIGVTFTGDGRVRLLDLSHCKKLTALPAELGLEQLTALTTLDLRGCGQLTALPAELGQLTALTTLDLGSCGQLTALPAELGQLTGLTTLDLSYCKQLTALPAELGQLTALTTLNLEGCGQLTALPAELGQLTGLTTLNLRGCGQLTALPKELCDIPTLKKIDATYCVNIAVPPSAIARQGLEAMRRYYAELEAASAASVTLKAVLMGPGEAGKTSLLRRLRDADAAVLPAASERTIGLEMTAMSLDPENDPKLKLLIYDFGGQPEYFPFHQLFLTPGALCIVVFDLSRDDCVDVIVEQFNILTMNAPLAVTMVVGTHLDQVVGGGAAAAAKLSDVQKDLEFWRAKQLKVRPKDCGDAPPLDLPNLRWPIIAVDSTGMNYTVDAARARIQELAFDKTLFPAFRNGIPLAYERLRAALVAVASERDPVVEVQALSRLDRQETWCSERYGGGADAAAGGVVVPYVEQSELLAIWQSTINDPALAKERLDIQSTPEKVFADALLIFEGEGFLMISHVSGLVHLDPSWLADCVKPIADHRIQNKEHRLELVSEWTEKDDNLDEGDTSAMLDKLAHNGVASVELLKLMFADDDEKRGTLSLDKRLELFVEHYLLLPLVDTSYLLPMKLRSWPPEDFDQTCQLREGQVAWECECELRARYFPPGLFSKMFTALHGLGEFRTYFASGGVLQDEHQTRTLVFAFDPTTFVLLLRVHGKESIQAKLREHLEEAAEKAKQVFNQFKGLHGVVRKDYEYKTAHDDANAKLEALLEGQRALKEEVVALREGQQRMVTQILGGMLELVERPLPYFFLLLPKAEAMQRAGKQDDPTSLRKRMWSGFERVSDKISPFVKFEVLFLCQSGRDDHSSAEGFSSCVHPPFEILTPGPILQKLAPVFRQLNYLLKATATVGKIAGYPLPSGLPFIGDMLKQDQIAFLGGIYDDAQHVDKDGAVNPTDENQWVSDLHAIAGGAEAAASSGGVESSADTHAAYEQMRALIEQKHPDWKAQCGLQRMCVVDSAAPGPRYRWVCAKCAAVATELGPPLAPVPDHTASS